MGTITMSRKEVSRLEWFAKVKRKELSLRSASAKMALSYRQAKRLWKRYEAQGEAGLVHGLRGQPSNRKTDAAVRRSICVLKLFQEKYHDGGPPWPRSIFRKRRQRSRVAVETLRSWLKPERDCISHGGKSRGHRAWRPRREQQTGELVQMDGSPHDWFGGRGPKAVADGDGG